MKKLIIYLSFCLATISAKAQFVDAVGASIGGTYGTHIWSTSEPNTTQKYLLGFNAAGLIEFFHNPTFRWRVELAYDQMGAKELVSGTDYKNRTSYLTLNNYLKIQFPQDNIMPYFLIGPRVEYLLSNGPQVYGNIIGSFPKVYFTAAAGVGLELVTNILLRPFVEAYYNRDVLPSYHQSGETINYSGFELKVGVRYVFDKTEQKRACPKVDNPMGN